MTESAGNSEESASAQPHSMRRQGSSRFTSFLVVRLLDLLSVIPLTWLRKAAFTLGRFSWWRGSESAQVTSANLSACYPDLAPPELAKLAADSLGHTACLLAEAGIVWRWPIDRVLNLVQSGREQRLLHEALNGSRGTLLLVPHFGNWEFLSPCLANTNLTALYDPPKIKALDQPIRAARERQGITMLPIDRTGLKGVISALKSGGFAVLLPDQVPGRQAGAVHADFFGQPALTMTLVHQLVRRTGAQVLLGAAIRCESGFDVHYERLDGEILAQSPEVAASYMNEAIENLVAKAPAQYQWEYKRFRRPPAGVADIYKR